MTLRWPLLPQLGLIVAVTLAIGDSLWLFGYDWTFVPGAGFGGSIGMMIAWRRGAVELSATELRRSGLHGEKTAYWAAVEAVTFERHRLSGYPVVWLKTARLARVGSPRRYRV